MLCSNSLLSLYIFLIKRVSATVGLQLDYQVENQQLFTQLTNVTAGFSNPLGFTAVIIQQLILKLAENVRKFVLGRLFLTNGALFKGK